MLKIKEIKLNKPEIKQCKYSEMGILPKHPFRSYIVGASQSGKTNYMLNLMTRDGYYKNYFDRIFVISPTALDLDKSYEELEKKNKYKKNKDLFFFNCDTEVLKTILDVQTEENKEKKVLVILDDVVSYKKFCNSNELLRFSVQSRHYNISMFILSQAFHLILKSIRLNMSNIVFFRGSDIETEILCQQYCPAGYNKKQFKELVEKATEEPYSFLFIDLNLSMHGKAPRYRCGLDKDLLMMFQSPTGLSRSPHRSKVGISDAGPKGGRK